MAERMTDLEALLWTVEKDPHLNSTFANLTLLDRSPRLERLTTRMTHAAVAVPRLRQRVAPGFGGLVPPEWRDDHDFDVEHHVRRVALPAGANRRQLLDLVVHLAAVPLDRARPLWRFTVIQGLEDVEGLAPGTRAAVLQQFHHSLTDGEGGVRMSVSFLDLERDAPDPAPVGPTVGDPPEWGLATTLTGAATHLARRAVRAGVRAGRQGLATAVEPSRVVAEGRRLRATAASLARQGLVTGSVRSPLWTRRSLQRHLELLRVPLADVKAAAGAHGVSVNTVFVAAAAGGAGRYHREHGSPVDELRMAMPISTRRSAGGGRGRAAAGNAFAPARILVPTGAMSPAERIAALHALVHETRAEAAVDLASGIAAVANLAPTSVLTRAFRAQAGTVDFTTSNVRGAPFPLYLAGGRITANHPLGPLAGTAWNLTTLSVDGWLDMGLVVDPVAVEDPEDLRRGIEQELHAVLAPSSSPT